MSPRGRGCRRAQVHEVHRGCAGTAKRKPMTAPTVHAASMPFGTDRELLRKLHNYFSFPSPHGFRLQSWSFFPLNFPIALRSGDSSPGGSTECTMDGGAPEVRQAEERLFLEGRRPRVTTRTPGSGCQRGFSLHPVLPISIYVQDILQSGYFSLYSIHKKRGAEAPRLVCRRCQPTRLRRAEGAQPAL